MRQAVFDIECYRNYFLISFKQRGGGYKEYSFRSGDNLLNHPDFIEQIRFIFSEYEVAGFNSLSYDIPMLNLAMAGYSTEQLKQVSDQIITESLTRWDLERRLQVKFDLFNSVDLIDVSPGQYGLKMYGGAMHIKRMQDLPYDPDLELTSEQMEKVRTYCRNDLQITEGLLIALEEPLEIRRRMGASTI